MCIEDGASACVLGVWAYRRWSDTNGLEGVTWPMGLRVDWRVHYEGDGRIGETGDRSAAGLLEKRRYFCTGKLGVICGIERVHLKGRVTVGGLEEW